MALVLADRVRDTTTTTGTGTVTLSGTAPTGYQNFSVIGNSNTTYYTINAGSQWEVGIGTYSSTGPTLARTTVLASSNSGSLVDFSTGTKDVFVTYPAERSVAEGYGLLPVANGGTGATTLSSGYLVKGNGTSAVSASVVYDNGTNVGIGTASPGSRLDVVAQDAIRATGFQPFLTLRDSSDANKGSRIQTASATTIFYNDTTGGGTYTERMRIDSSGNVGIGTSAPSSRLTITGGITEIRDGNYLMLRPSGNAWDMRLQATGTQLDILSGGSLGSPIMSLLNGGNVGIGTSSPGAKLDTKGLVRSSIGTGTGAGGAGYAFYQFGTSATATENWHIGAEGDGSFRFYNQGFGAGLERIRITSSGNASIGTTVGLARLRVAAAGAVNAPVLGNVTNYPAFFSNSDVGYGLGLGTSAGDGHVWLQAQRSDSATAYNITLNEAGGNVGIGTSSPAVKLDVNGGINFGQTMISGGGVSTGDVAVELGGNRSGSGNSYIDWHSTAGTDFESRIVRYGGTNGGMDIINMGTGGLVISQEGAAPMVFKTTATERMRITSNGSVGIGTSSPQGLLHVVAGTNDTLIFRGPVNLGTGGSIYAVNSANSAVTPLEFGASVYYFAGGNVGIGTSSPNASALLDVQSTTKGFRLPNMTTTQKNAIATPAAGLMVFDTTLAKACVYTGSAWQTITSI